MKNREMKCKIKISLNYNEHLKTMTITLLRVQFGKVNL